MAGSLTLHWGGEDGGAFASLLGENPQASWHASLVGKAWVIGLRVGPALGDGIPKEPRYGLGLYLKHGL